MDDILLDEEVEVGRMVSLAEVKLMLEAAAEEREDMTYEQKIALEHARRFARVDVDNANKMIAELKALVPDVDEMYAFKVADLTPQHPDDVRSIYQKSGAELSDDDLEKIIDVVDKYYVA